MLPVGAQRSALVPGEHSRDPGIGEQPGRPHLDQSRVAGDGGDPRGVVRAQHVPLPGVQRPGHRAVEVAHGRHHVHRGTPRDGQRQVGEPQVRARPGEPGPQRLDETLVIHHRLPPVAELVVVQVVEVFAHQQAAHRVDRGASGSRHVGVVVVGRVPSGHVGDVDPPPVQPERRTQEAPHHRFRTGDHPAPELRRAPVELRQGRHPQPRHVVEGDAVDLGLHLRAPLLGLGALPAREVDRGVLRPVVEPALDRVPVRQRCLEPLVPVPGVVGGEVADQVHAARVDGVREPGECRVPAQRGIHPRERGRVVAVRAARREEGRQVEQVDPQVLEVVEPGGDPVEIAAEELPDGGVPLLRGLVVPVRRHRPLRGGTGIGGSRAGEPVGKDLVPDGVCGPVRGVREHRHPEVAHVRDVPREQSPVGEPHVVLAPPQQPAVAHHRVVHRHRHRVPPLVRVLALQAGGQLQRVAVPRDPQQHPGLAEAPRDAQPDLHDVPERELPAVDVQPRTVVVRQAEQVRRSHLPPRERGMAWLSRVATTTGPARVSPSRLHR